MGILKRPAHRSQPEEERMVRAVLRRDAVLRATGWSVPTLYRKIKEKKFPAGTRLDPDGQAVVWFEDEIEAFQKAAVSAAMEAAA
jgi:predicted DNA-binding transcriptional regulator AlpA